MEPFIIEESAITPRIEFDKKSGVFQIHGRSLPEDATYFYKPVLAWFKKYLEIPNRTTTLNLKLVYLNTASSKIILELIKLLTTPAANGLDVKVHWHHHEDDEDNLELGQDYETMLKVPFIFTPYKD